jgi:hypothetical protein
MYIKPLHVTITEAAAALGVSRKKQRGATADERTDYRAELGLGTSGRGLPKLMPAITSAVPRYFQLVSSIVLRVDSAAE